MASERPTASTLLKHQFVQQIGISNDEDDTTGDDNVNTTAMTSAGVHCCYYVCTYAIATSTKRSSIIIHVCD